MKLALTPMQQKVFEFLLTYTEDNGFPPSYSEIATAFKFSSDGTVRTYLEQLERKNYIRRLGRARGIQFLEKPETNSIPIAGKIAAGTPISAIESDMGSIFDLPTLNPSPNRFALKVNGDSMIDVGIFDGDFAIIEKTSTIKSGQIAAVLIDDEATLKRIHVLNSHIQLLSENKKYPPIELKKGIFEANLLGRYIGLIREH